MKKLTLTLLFFPCVCASYLSAQTKKQAGIKSMDVPFQEYTYDNSTCSGFKYSSGSLIFIPSDAFVMDDGSACNGKIIVRYRELHTRADMLVSGVNMILIRNGKRKMLESAGMFEIKAECNGKPMKIAPEKYIQVRMKSMNNLSNLQSFIYDKEKSYWLDAGISIVDLSFKNGDNNADNFKLWGSSRIQGQSVVNMDSIGMERGYVSISKIIGKLPDGYIKGMNIKTMGFYNYDAVIKDENAVPILAKFKLKTGEAVTELVYVAYIKKNTLIYYSPDDMKERFVLLPEKGIRIFCPFKDGTVAVMNQNDLDALNIPNLKGKEFTFTLEKVPAKPKDKAELAAVAKIN